MNILVFGIQMVIVKWKRFKFQLQYYVPDKNAIGHSAQIAELDVESEGEEEEYALATEKKAATSTGGLW